MKSLYYVWSVLSAANYITFLFGVIFHTFDERALMIFGIMAIYSQLKKNDYVE
jgi:hypothetical protein